jgi:hypothetical protein
MGLLKLPLRNQELKRNKLAGSHSIIDGDQMNTIRMEPVQYVCADCKGDTWKLVLGFNKEEGKTYLIITCANPICVESKRVALGGKPGELVIWDTFDVSGQGYDVIDEVIKTPKGELN